MKYDNPVNACVIGMNSRINLKICYKARSHLFERILSAETWLTSGVDGHLGDGGPRHVVVDELADLHQHQRVHVMRDVKVPVYHGADQTGARQRVAAARHSRWRDRCNTTHQTETSSHANRLINRTATDHYTEIWNTVIGTLAVDWWAVTFGTARRACAGWGPAQSPSRCTKCNSPPINGQCTNFILFHMALYCGAKNCTLLFLQ